MVFLAQENKGLKQRISGEKLSNVDK
jgi:hypothetical protein